MMLNIAGLMIATKDEIPLTIHRKRNLTHKRGERIYEESHFYFTSIILV